jgi:hypothetical protein
MTADFPICVNAQMTTSEIYWACAAVTARALRKFLWIWSSVTALCAFGVLSAWLDPKGDTAWNQILQNLKPLIWLLLLFPFFAGLVAPWFSVWKFLNDRRNAGGTRFQFSGDGVRIQTSVCNADFNWTAFLRVQETKSFLALHNV